MKIRVEIDTEQEEDKERVDTFFELLELITKETFKNSKLKKSEENK